jgi:hypothetical protein
MPTTRPRYTVTDTGEVGEMLDLAQRAWPDITDRKRLLLRLAAVGRDAIQRELDEADAAQRRADQVRAMRRAGELVDVDLLLADGPWQ